MEILKEKLSNKTEIPEAEGIELTCYTDPLCCWSWALFPLLQKLVDEFTGYMQLQLCMGGLIPDWTKFSDPLNSLNHPSQMGPMWMDAARKTGTAINENVWVNNPPQSSYPACIAVKTAGLQSADAEKAYFRALQEAVMLNMQDISQKEVLWETANGLSKEQPHLLDLPLFEKQFNGPQSRETFRNDLAKTRLLQIGRFPTVTFSRPGFSSLMFTGYRPYAALLEAFSVIAPDLLASKKLKTNNISP